jgi:hypothetical protein
MAEMGKLQNNLRRRSAGLVISAINILFLAVTCNSHFIFICHKSSESNDLNQR